ncbi:MAG TPA: HAD hydrolase family protein [Acidobacteriota bacterium]|mgnify:CR=1 FL=1|nr:HAD hydrolase family protein [Acidobacteriota bacterium]
MSESRALEQRLQKIRLLLTDVDGVLTDGKIARLPDGDELKFFSIYDGLAVRLAQRHGIEVGFMSGRESRQVALRAAELGVRLLLQGTANKLQALDEVCRQRKLSLEEVGYIGDDLPDIRVLLATGFSAAPANAADAVKQVVGYVARTRGGEGVLREIVELILCAQGKWPQIIQEYREE